MKRTASLFYMIVLLSFAGCSAGDSAKAIIRVTGGDPLQGNAAVFVETEIVTSHFFLQHVDKALELSKLWKLSEDQVETKLRNSITVEAGNEPGLFVIGTKGLEHQLAVRILNELCTFYTQHWFGESQIGGQPQTVHVSIIQRAE